jgi:mono/diheme cytochrome c family protein
MRSLVYAAAAVAGLLAAGAASAQPGDAALGAQVFAQNCAACHQANGEGIKGAFPALAGDPFVLGDPKAIAYVPLHGRGGMPNFSEDLTDAEIAAVLTYVRSSWGNHAPAVEVATVAAVRGATDGPPKDKSVLPGH